MQTHNELMPSTISTKLKNTIRVLPYLAIMGMIWGYLAASVTGLIIGLLIASVMSVIIGGATEIWPAFVQKQLPPGYKDDPPGKVSPRLNTDIDLSYLKNSRLRSPHECGISHLILKLNVFNKAKRKPIQKWSIHISIRAF